MTILYIAFNKALAIAYQTCGRWEVSLHLTECQPQCLAVDRQLSHYVFCGAADQGLWRSRDAGANWMHVGDEIVSRQVTAVAVSELDRANGAGIVYAGTEPSAFYRSEDQGKSWQESKALLALPSAPTWSFPPRPWTSHVRWIAPDPLVAGRVFVAVEAGALVRSLDGGETWEDRVQDGPFDTHTLAVPALAPNRLYSAAGDGFMHAGNGFVQSDDGGATWSRPDDGLAHHYLWSIAADPRHPDTILISAAFGPRQAHDTGTAESYIYRRVDGSPWQMASDGLPPSRGSLGWVLAADEVEAGVFYAANNHGVFCSTDNGLSWETLPVPWPEGMRFGRANAIVVAP
jgi:hypothetical protein